MVEPEHDEPVPAVSRIDLRELRGNLVKFIQQARAGRSFVVTSHDQVLAEIRPPSPAALRRRLPGALRGKILMAPDFDTLPPDLLTAIESGDE